MITQTLSRSPPLSSPSHSPLAPVCFGRQAAQPPNHRPNPPRLHLLRLLQERCLRDYARQH